MSRRLDVDVHQAWALREAWAGADRYFLHAAAERVAERPEILKPGSSSSSGSSSSNCNSSMGAAPAAPTVVRPAAAPTVQGLGGPVTTFASMGAADAADWGAGSVAEQQEQAAPPAGALRQLGADMADAFRTVSHFCLAAGLVGQVNTAASRHVRTCK